jgi:hypothetical protein
MADQRPGATHVREGEVERRNTTLYDSRTAVLSLKRVSRCLRSTPVHRGVHPGVHLPRYLPD